MSQSLKQIKNRIRSIENTRKVTSAMQMISATKLSRIDSYLSQSRPYAQRLTILLDKLLQGRTASGNPFLRKDEAKGKILLCVVTSDNGLCGVYNNNVIRLAEEFISRYERNKVKLVVIGKKGYAYFRNYKEAVLHTYVGLNGKYSDKVSREICKALCQAFLTAEADEVYIAYTRFKNALTNKAVVEKFLNIDCKEAQEIGYILEPNEARILEELIPEYLSAKTRLMLLESFTSEHASRLMAMRTATENAKELLTGLILLRNKVRQANITREIIEIVSAAEALKG
ncbi:MAG: ATP synthase F1 subunit gamma [Omnitrophica WOR_2 bacterium GWF2_43_52]|nr:MAG: ATP synthase F1 subunit gamma [Omnitrophica WOR_2 bacterium GWC2_44_8]OGX20767.1 MAG: ATP synthase F1 subunit gamma [Omnitrophica WOR_2 bacterium GWF2_43_52]OGX53243.1 MAG: ATP synthase F1 subunit gamma [Omnitrophica WOR_2 bacterium RIFOXYC2_FULL_43_9]HAH19790.1 ATP synthase F1 subunit gamma [Candidatus Omnitrophota bacterium]HBG63415.1 ATP synthase F1 subunit gamma [Candidatus Omnitrophota bacterium]